MIRLLTTRSLATATTTLFMLLAVACGDSTTDGNGEALSNTPTKNEAPSTGQGQGQGTNDPNGNNVNTPPSTPPSAQEETKKTAPALLSVSPAAGAKGVRADAPIVFTFTKPMNAALTEAAFASKSIPNVTFAWNDAGDVLTVTPAAPLAYAVGDQLVPSLSFDARIGTTAVDRDGNALAAEASTTFETLRRITVHAPAIKELTGSVRSSDAIADDGLLIGDSWIGPNAQYKAFVTFSLDNVPSSDLEIEKATFSAAVKNLVGTPDANLGKLRAEHVVFDEVGILSFTTKTHLVSEAASYAGFNGAPPTRASIVTDLVKDDLANRAERKDRSQIRLAYVTATDTDGTSDYCVLDASQLDLVIIYLAQ